MTGIRKRIRIRRRGNAIDRLEEDEEEAEEKEEEEEEDAPQILVLIAPLRFLGTPADARPFGLQGRGETEGGRKQDRGRRRRREVEGARGRARAAAWNNGGKISKRYAFYADRPLESFNGFGSSAVVAWLVG